ncbi:MAG: HEAT repeat domain-containing protein [Planctomycetota bacterium]
MNPGKTGPAVALLKRIQSGLYRDQNELANLLQQVAQQRIEAKHLTWMLTHRDAEVRTFGARRIAESAEASTVDALLHDMVNQPTDVRRELARLAMRLDPARVDQQIGRLAASRTSSHRECALAVLAAHPRWSRHMNVLKAGLRDPSAELRRAAMQVLASDPELPAALLLLKDLMHAEDPVLRQEALQILAATQNPEIVEPFLERLPHEGPAERAIIVRALSGLVRDPRAKLAERILPSLADERDSVRQAAVQLLTEFPDRTEFLRTFLLDAPTMVYWLRDRCIKALLSVADRLAEPLLELMHDPDEEVRVGAMTLAAKTKDPRFLAPVRDLFVGGGDWWARVIAADVLAEFDRPDVVDCLASQISDPDLRYGVIAALGKTQSAHALPHLVRALGDPTRGIRSCALEALRGFTDPRAVAAVTQLAGGDPESAIRDKARSVLETMGNAAATALRGLTEVEAPLVDGTAGSEPIQLEMENPALNEPPSQ